MLLLVLKIYMLEFPISVGYVPLLFATKIVEMCIKNISNQITNNEYKYRSRVLGYKLHCFLIRN